MGKVVKQDRQVSTKPLTSKDHKQAPKGKLSKSPQPGANGTAKYHTHPKDKPISAKQDHQKKATVKEQNVSKNAADPDIVPPKPSHVARDQAFKSANPGHVSSVEVGSLSGKYPQSETVPSTMIESETTIPVREAAATLDKRVASEMAEKEQIRLTVAGEKKVMENGQSTDSSQEEAAVEFCWNASVANSVQITGSFNGWEEKLDMTKVDDSWKVVIPLEKGRHAYKFIVDGEWCYDITKENEHDNDGNINNIVTV